MSPTTAQSTRSRAKRTKTTAATKLTTSASTFL